jgi:hypothetical protein
MSAYDPKRTFCRFVSGRLVAGAYEFNPCYADNRGNRGVSKSRLSVEALPECDPSVDTHEVSV